MWRYAVAATILFNTLLAIPTDAGDSSRASCDDRISVRPGVVKRGSPRRNWFTVTVANLGKEPVRDLRVCMDKCCVPQQGDGLRLLPGESSRLDMGTWESAWSVHSITTRCAVTPEFGRRGAD